MMNKIGEWLFDFVCEFGLLFVLAAIIGIVVGVLLS